jgi:hypothetical protein
MSLSAISAVASAALPTVNFHPRGHHRGARVDNDLTNSSSAAGSVGQLPVGATSGLFSHLLQSLQQTVSAQSTAVSAATSSTAATAATGTSVAAAASPNVQQDLQAFMHSLFQAASATSAVGAASATTAAPAAIATTTGSAAIAATGPYQGSLVSSLQALIQQLGASGTTTAATSNLQTSFNRLVNDLGSGANTGSSTTNAASNPSSNASLQNFLSNLSQNLQTNGVHSLASVGAHVNANS